MKFLSKRQYEVMEILWEKDVPMLASEILEANKELNINTVQAVLRSLVKKKYIEITDIAYSGTVLARRYRPIVTKKEYIFSVCGDSQSIIGSSAVIANFVKKEKDMKVLEELEKMIADAKEKLKG